MNIPILRIGVPLPRYGSSGAAGFDLHAKDSGTIYPGQTLKVGLGIATAIPKGHCVLVLPRSGLGSAGIILQNCVGLIDEDFRGEWTAVLRNESNEPYEFLSGQRICQGILIQYGRADFVEVEVGGLPSTERGVGGFGSTGV